MHQHVPILYWFPGLTDESRIPAPYAARFAAQLSIERGVYGPDGGSGPSARRGLLASPFHGACSYRPGQRWLRVDSVDGQEVWIGRRVGVQPAELWRGSPFGGSPVTLGDGCDWTIPVCNPDVRSCQLPGYDARVDGRWTRLVDDAYAPLARRAQVIAGDLREQMLRGTDNPSIELDDAELQDLACEILALNYDITPAEVGALALFRSAQHYGDILAAWIDLPAMLQLMATAISQAQEAGPGRQLNPFAGTPATPSTSSGGAVSLPPTDLHLPTSGS